MAAKRGEAHHRAKLTDDIVMRCREEYRIYGASIEELAELEGVSHSSMRWAIRGLSYAHLPGAVTVEDRPRIYRGGVRRWDLKL